jgi:hypothetical protein
MITSECVHELLLDTWGKQACRRPEDWPDVLGRLLKDGVCTGPGSRRTSFAPRVEDAVAQLTAAYAAGAAPGPDLVWRCFPMLDREHAKELAALLTAETAAVATASQAVT